MVETNIILAINTKKLNMLIESQRLSSWEKIKSRGMLLQHTYPKFSDMKQWKLMGEKIGKFLPKYNLSILISTNKLNIRHTKKLYLGGLLIYFKFSKNIFF